MSESLAHTFEHNGFRVEIHYDIDGGSYADPRQNSNNGLFVGFAHRRYAIGDEQVDPRDLTLDCTGCQGDGTVEYPFLGEQVERDCALCQGEGEISVRTFEQAQAWARANYNVVGPVLPVSLYEHSGVSYSVGFARDPWDSGDAGLIFATRETLDECQGEGVTPSDEDLTTWLTGEIQEYSKWANGEVYGYVILDRNGGIVDSCWGFIGSEYVEQAAREACPEADEQPPVLHTVRLTDAHLDVLDALLADADQALADPERSAAAQAREVLRSARPVAAEA